MPKQADARCRPLRSLRCLIGHHRILHCGSSGTPSQRIGLFAKLYRGRNPKARPATTLVAAYVSNWRLHYVSAGDSLLYLLRGTRFRLLNSPGISRHSMIGFGVDGVCKGSVPLQSGDKIILASDGLYPDPKHDKRFRSDLGKRLAKLSRPTEVVA
ncbi:MAG: SpoIIE family protein phosphatase [Nevskiales bacterium]